jgi:hypothetical protein
MPGPITGGLRMERWVLVFGVIAIFLGLAAMGWHYQQGTNDARMCTSAEAQCDERRL